MIAFIEHRSMLLVGCARRGTAVKFETSVGRVADGYDNALAEMNHSLCKVDVAHGREPWHNFEAVAFATLEWVDECNNGCLLEPICNIPPAEAEER
ncbi:hypothetical protein AX760_17775 [Pararhizobium antarcticum]|uniref:Uncharacterized protein n=1 Tax=Pararhizobium antarcticum TaxID=1798805 RepID=A0A657LTC0_9HYPH|nr:hypothetical protein AX760_17775 [Pararhizobium antarcticum]OJF96747.1 hypothetical protein AX761_15615 [Rhizobium sp. 58]